MAEPTHHAFPLIRTRHIPNYWAEPLRKDRDYYSGFRKTFLITECDNMATKNPVLAMTPITYFSVAETDLNAFITTVFRSELVKTATDYWASSNEECDRDGEFTIYVNGFHYDLSKSHAPPERNYWPSLRHMLSEACFRKLIPAGHYLIRTNY